MADSLLESPLKLRPNDHHTAEIALISLMVLCRHSNTDLN
jgi:hypothetical protein